MDTPVVVGLIAAAGATVGAVLTWLSARRGSQLTAMSKWIDQLQASEAAAKREAQESKDRADRIKEEADADVKALRTELDGVTGQVRQLQRLVDQMTDRMAQVQAEVWRPEPDLEALRRFVGRPATGT